MGNELKLAVSAEDAAEESTNDISSFSEAMNELGDLFNKKYFPSFLSTFLKVGNNGDKILVDRIKSLWDMFIDIARNENPGEFQGDFSLSKNHHKQKVL